MSNEKENNKSKQRYKEFLEAKEDALLCLEKACIDRLVDERVQSVLSLLNASDEYYTTSSCAGRIMVLELPALGDKRRARILGKWHQRVDLKQIETCVLDAKEGMIWLFAQAPILHIGCDTLESANTLVKLAVSCGFKNSMIKSTGKKIVVELSSTERVDVPLGADGELFCDMRYLQLLTDISNMVLQRSELKIQQLEKKLRNL